PKIAALSTLPHEFVFIDKVTPGADEPFNDSEPITSDLQEMLFPFPGALVKARGAESSFEPLVRTGTYTGTIPFNDLRDILRGGGGRDINMQELTRREQPATGESYVLAAR